MRGYLKDVIFNSMVRNERNGFTLIETIIVVVILGILAAVAVPKITENIDKAKAAEAFQFLGTMRMAFWRCIDDNYLLRDFSVNPITDPELQSCDSFTEMGITNPAGTAEYVQSNGYQIDAGMFSYLTRRFAGMERMRFRASLASDPGSSYIVFENFMNGDFQKSCGGHFAKMCK